MLAEKFAGITPYQFGFNNPVMFNDPKGDQGGNNNSSACTNRRPKGLMEKGQDGNYRQAWANDVLFGNSGVPSYTLGQ